MFYFDDTQPKPKAVAQPVAGIEHEKGPTPLRLQALAPHLLAHGTRQVTCIGCQVVKRSMGRLEPFGHLFTLLLFADELAVLVANGSRPKLCARTCGGLIQPEPGCFDGRWLVVAIDGSVAHVVAEDEQRAC